MLWRSLCAAGVVLLLAGAASGEEAPEAQVTVGEDWLERLEKINADLLAGRWAEAAREASAVADEMVETLDLQPGADYALASVAAYQALAAAGLGDGAEATWRWAAAQNLYTPYRDADLTPYGEAGAKLAPHRLREAGEPKEGVLRIAEVSQPPVPKETPGPLYPALLQRQGVTGYVVVEAVVGADGRLRHPLLVETSAGPPMVVAAFEALRQWRFEPARKDGETVPVIQMIRVVFELGE